MSVVSTACLSYNNVVVRNERVLLVAASRFTMPQMRMVLRDDELPWRCNMFSLARQYFDYLENRNGSAGVKL